jgi:hypothetical protein
MPGAPGADVAPGFFDFGVWPRRNSENRLWVAHPCGFCKGGVFPLSLFQFLFPSYAFVKRTRTSQKISKISGSMLRIKYKVVLNKAGDRCCPSPTAESNLSVRFEGPRKTLDSRMDSQREVLKY